MKFYKIQIEPLSALGTQLQADTIFGHFAWAYKYLYGEDKLKTEIIEPSKNYSNNSNIPIIFSNGFPKDFLPIPVIPEKLPKNDEDKKSENKKQIDIADYKKIKKIKYLCRKKFDEIRKTYNQNSIKKLYVEMLGKDKDKKEEYFKKNMSKKSVQIHNTINRLTGTTTEDGGLYVKYNQAFEEKSYIDIYIALNEAIINRDKLNDTLKLLFELGYGRDASTGLGRFSYDGNLTEENDFTDFTGYNSIMSLSNFIPDIMYKDFYYNLMTKYGKLGGEYACHGNPFKKPVLMAEAGATFKIEPSKKLYGSFINEMHSDKELNVHQYGFCFPYPINIVEEDSNG